MRAPTPQSQLRCWKRAVGGLIALTLACTSVQAQNDCQTKATLENPAAEGTGIGAWWRGLWKKSTPPSAWDVGDRGIDTARPGIGGTGIDNGGIGGTGIVGVITGFASICVNGVEVHFDATTPLSVDGRKAAARELAVGQVVAVRAAGTHDQVSALHIAVLHALVGPVSQVDANSGHLVMMGQRVRADSPAEMSNLQVGDWAQVSGYRMASGELAASRIEPVSSKEQVQVSGQIDQVDANGFNLYGARVNLGQTVFPKGLASGTEVSVRGRWDGTSLQVQTLDVEPVRQTVGQVDRVVFEGFVHALRGREVSLGGQVVTLDEKAQIWGNNAQPLSINQRVQVTGRVGADRRVMANRVEVRGSSSRLNGARGRRDDSGRAEETGKGDAGGSGPRSGSDDGGTSGSGSGTSGSKSGSGSGTSGSSGGGGKSGGK